jgi:hypothetical protein
VSTVPVPCPLIAFLRLSGARPLTPNSSSMLGSAPGRLRILGAASLPGTAALASLSSWRPVVRSPITHAARVGGVRSIPTDMHTNASDQKTAACPNLAVVDRFAGSSALTPRATDRGSVVDCNSALSTPMPRLLRTQLTPTSASGHKYGTVSLVSALKKDSQMSRYCGDVDSKSILDAAMHWRDEALIGEGSVLTPKKLWMVPSLEAPDRHFVQRPDLSDAKFLKKLELQLEPADADAKQLAAEMMWLMYLCPSSPQTISGRRSKRCGPGLARRSHRTPHGLPTKCWPVSAARDPVSTRTSGGSWSSSSTSCAVFVPWKPASCGE